MWKIGNIEIKNQVVLAPMAGISNTAYRQIIKEMGAGLIYAEMVSDKAICYGSERTYELLKMNESERPIAQQIFGSDLTSFVEAAKKIEDYIISSSIFCLFLRSSTSSSILSTLYHHTYYNKNNFKNHSIFTSCA